MKKIIVNLILWAAIILCIITNPVQASSSDLFLNHLDFQAQINDDGSMNVTEKWDIEIEDTNTLYKTFETDKTKYSNIRNVEVREISNGSNHILGKQNQWAYHLPKGYYFGGMNEDNKFEIAWGVGLEDETATKTYTISYQVQDAVAKYNDYAELYWQFVGKDFEIDAQNITGTILLPSNVSSKDEIKVWGHTEDLNGEIYTTDTDRIEFSINQFRAGRYVEIRTLFPTEMIISSGRTKNIERLDTVIEEESIWAEQANARRKMRETSKTIVAILINIIVIIVGIFSIKSIIKNSKKIKTSKKLKPSQPVEYYREMPREDSTPAQALVLYSKQIGVDNSMYLGRIFSATLLDLSLKKIIDFEVKGKVVTIKILKENPTELENLKDEKVIFEFLKKSCQKDEKEITVKELEKYIKKAQNRTKVMKLGEEVNKKTEEALYEKELASKEGVNEKTKLTASIIGLAVTIPSMIIIFVALMSSSIKALAVIPYIIVAVIQLIVFCILTSKTNILTQQGTDEHAKWKGLKKYMEDFSMLDKREVPEIIIWEKFLVYATVFGIADKVLKQLKIVYPNMGEEELGTNQYAYMYLMMNTNFSSNFSNAISNSMSTAYSSATGGGGGFSGGGGGRTVDGGGGGGR